jgi:hypothetical protein
MRRSSTQFAFMAEGGAEGINGAAVSLAELSVFLPALGGRVARIARADGLGRATLRSANLPPPPQTE